MARRSAYILLGVLLGRRQRMHRWFWNRRAADISRRWKADSHDFELLGNLIRELNIESILDIGCGWGRLFPLYEKESIPQVVGQDISSEALKIAWKKNPGTRVKLICAGLPELKFAQPFDLLISNRVLSAVLPEQIHTQTQALATYARYFYINEMTESDYAPGCPYWFLHDYIGIFEKYGCRLLRRGSFPDLNETWYLFQKNE